MSNYALLYYPDFSPDPAWLRRILLLADQVARIVPNDVDPGDPEDLLAMQERIPDCLSTISPEPEDVALESDGLPRLSKAFAYLAESRGSRSAKQIEITFSGGDVSIAGHVFLHDSKLSSVVRSELRSKGLVIDELSELYGQDGFLVVHEGASDLILAGVAANIARRVGLDAITDKPLPFALNALNVLNVGRREATGSAEGALLASLTSVLIPAQVSVMDLRDYRDLRESYAEIRGAFRAMTAELSSIHRLSRISDPEQLQRQVEVTAREFFEQYRAYRKSRFARAFKKWTPLSVGGLLSIVGTIVSPPAALAIAGVSVGIQIVERQLESGSGRANPERTFHMLAGLRRDIIRRSGIKDLI
jgi:hypothetical protein